MVKLSHTAKYLATASERGTLIRIWSTQTSALHKEFRRGILTRHIKDINFDFNENILMVCSNSQNIHFFFLNQENAKCRFHMLGVINSYLGSEWSKYRIKVPQGEECFSSWKVLDGNAFYLFFRSGFVRELRLKDEPDEEEIEIDYRDMTSIFNDAFARFIPL